MTELTILRRIFPGASLSPPRRATGVACGGDDPAGTVILELGKAPRGKVFSTSYKVDIKRYMTKRQVELLNDGSGPTGPQRT
jgi:hypothetical protein